MIIKNITDMDGFFSTIDKCKGRVELLTSEGDRLNLKSKLCQYVAFASIFKDLKIENMELVVSEPDDINLLLKYLVG